MSSQEVAQYAPKLPKSQYGGYSYQRIIIRSVEGETWDQINAPGDLMKGFISTMIGISIANQAMGIALPALKKAGLLDSKPKRRKPHERKNTTIRR